MKSTVKSPAVVAILFFIAIICVLALIWLPIKGLWRIYSIKVAAHKQSVAAAGQQWMQQVEAAFVPIPEEVLAVEPVEELTMAVEGISLSESPYEGPSIESEGTVEIKTQEVPSLQQAIIEELRQLPTTKRRNAWGKICHQAKVAGGNKLRNRSLESQAEFLASQEIPLEEIAKAIEKVLAA